MTGKVTKSPALSGPPDHTPPSRHSWEGCTRYFSPTQGLTWSRSEIPLLVDIQIRVIRLLPRCHSESSRSMNSSTEPQCHTQMGPAHPENKQMKTLFASPWRHREGAEFGISSPRDEPLLRTGVHPLPALSSGGSPQAQHRGDDRENNNEKS